MKKVLTCIIIAVITLSSCSSDDNGSNPIEVNDYTNTNNLKAALLGTWKLKAHFSDYWVNTTGNSYYTFNDNNTFMYKSIIESDPVETGTYELTPATTTTNAKIKLIFSSTYSKNLTLLSLQGNIAEIQNTTFKERYEKQ